MDTKEIANYIDSNPDAIYGIRNIYSDAITETLPLSYHYTDGVQDELLTGTSVCRIASDIQEAIDNAQSYDPDGTLVFVTGNDEGPGDDDWANEWLLSDARIISEV